MSKKNTVKKAALELKEPAVVTQPEAVTTAPAAEVKNMSKRVVRGHKYDGRDIDLSKLTQKLVVGDISPKPPRGNGRPSVMYRIFTLVAQTPNAVMGELIQTIIDRSPEFTTHPSPYTHKDKLEALWVRDYLKGMIIKGHLKVAE